jgi:hypothetical protein
MSKEGNIIFYKKDWWRLSIERNGNTIIFNGKEYNIKHTSWWPWNWWNYNSDATLNQAILSIDDERVDLEKIYNDKLKDEKWNPEEIELSDTYKLESKD